MNGCQCKSGIGRKLAFIAAALALLMMFLVEARASSGQKDGTKSLTSSQTAQAFKAQVEKYIAYDKAIQLTPEQQKIRTDALTKIPAPCCSNFTIDTCCCPCNMAKSVWGLTKNLIVAKHYNAKQVEMAVWMWLETINENKPAGDACVKGRCEQPFDQDGCGGMGKDVVM